MPKRVREEEEWARRVLEKHLGAQVHTNDDGSADSMYDLRVGPKGKPEIAIECVRDADTARMRTWNKGPRKGAFQLQTPGDWVIEVSRDACVSDIEKRLGPLLTTLHEGGRYQMEGDCCEDAPLAHQLKALGVVDVSCICVTGGGKVYLSMAQPGGIVDPTGKDLAEWVTRFLVRDTNQDVLYKLAKSNAAARHVFVIVTLNGTINGPLLHHFAVRNKLPAEFPGVPSPVTGVWLMPPSLPTGLYWDSAGWQAVDGNHQETTS